MNLLFSINRGFIPLLLSCLHSVVLRGGESHYDAYILHSDLSTKEELYIWTNISESVTCHFIPVPEELFDGFPETKRYPLQIYYRLAAPLLLPENLDQILYLDVDTVVINSLQPLNELGIDDSCLAACTHTRSFLQKFNQIRLGMEEEIPYINTGVLLMNLKELRRHLCIEDIRNYALQYRYRLLLPDQDILTALCGDRVKLLDSVKYNLNDRVLTYHNLSPKNERLDLNWVRENAVIIHYFGRNKPWKEHYHGFLNVFYHEYGLPIQCPSTNNL